MLQTGSRGGLWLLIVAVILPLIGYGQGGIPLWTNRYSLNDGLNAYSAVLAIDKTGNIIVAGTVWYFEQDYGVVAYSNNGAALWTNRFSTAGSGNDQAEAVAVDPDGNIYVTGGTAQGQHFDFGTVSYSPAGVQRWANYYNGPGNAYDEAMKIVVSPNGNIIVTGPSASAGNDLDFLTIAYSNSGVPLWTNRCGGVAGLDDSSYGLAVDNFGNVLVTGSSSVTGSGRDFVTIKYSAAAGLALWTNTYDGPVSGNDLASAIVCDASGNVILTGASTGIGGDMDFATIKYSNSGLALWTNRFNGSGNGADWPAAVGVDDRGNVFVTGYSIGGYGDYDFVTLSYSSDGRPLWTNWYGGLGNDQPIAMALDRAGNVFVTGYNDRTYGTVAYSNSGVPLWTNRFKSLPDVGQDNATAIAVDADGNVFVSGISYGNHGYDRATIKYSSSIIPPPHLNFTSAGTQLVLTWTNSNFSLQSSPSPVAGFTNISFAASPYTNVMIGPPLYFRLVSD